MPKIDLEQERKKLDREITFFHFKKAGRRAARALSVAQQRGDQFFIYYFTAQLSILKEQLRKAILLLDRALTLRHNDGCAYNDKALSLAELGNYDQALACFNEGLRRDRNCITLYHNKGWLLNLLGRYPEAVMCLKKALELEPQRPESLYSLADTYYKLKQFSRAHDYFSKALTAVKGKSRYMYRETLTRLKAFSP